MKPGIPKWFKRKKKQQTQVLPPIEASATPIAPDGLLPILGPDTYDISPYARLLRENSNGRTRDFAGMAVGSAGNMLSLLHVLAEYHQMRSNNLGVLAGFSSTKTDLPNLKEFAAAHNPVECHSEGINGDIGVYDVVSHHVLARTIDSLFSTDGNGTDPLVALSQLQEDPRLADMVAQFSWDAASCIRNHRVRGCNLLTIETGGGSGPEQELAVDLFQSFVAVNRHYRLYLEPSLIDEPLHVPNMRGKVAYDLLHPPKVPTINFWWQAGPKSADKAVLGGIMCLTGNAPDHRELAPANQFAVLKSEGDWFLAVPKIVPIPLKLVDRLNADRLPSITRVDLPEELGGAQVAELLKAVRELLMEDPAANHTITVLGVLTPAEIEELKRDIQRFTLEKGGSLRVVVGYMNPEVRDGDALYLLCDFRAGPEVYERLRNLLLAPANHSNGVQWDELKELAAKLPELHVAERIHQELAHIRRLTNWR